VLARDPLCVSCLSTGRVVPSDTADHITPLEWGGTWSLTNGQGLCTPCHQVKRGHEAHDHIVRVVEGRGLVVVGTGGRVVEISTALLAGTAPAGTHARPRFKSAANPQ